MPDREDHREDWTAFVAGDIVYIAALDGEPIGYAGLYTVDADVLEFSLAGTRPAVRGRSAGVALVEHALHDAHENGFRRCRVDYRSTNLLASRFWRSRGFQPTHYRLRRDVQPFA